MADPEGLLYGLDLGESYGESAALYWATKSIDPSNTFMEDVFYTGMGLFSSLWTPCTSKDTFWTLLPSGSIGKWLGRPFWRYVGPYSEKAITWMTRGWGWKPPYSLAEAATKLHLLEYGGEPTGIIKVPYKMLTPIAGPGLVKAWGKFTGATQYYYGRLIIPK